MQVNAEALEQLARQKNWSKKLLAQKLGVHYSHLFRVLKHEKGAGPKFLAGLHRVCRDEGLNIERYIFFN